MAHVAHQFGLFHNSLALGLIDWTNDTIKAMLTTNSYTPNQDTHDFKNDVTNEVSGTGYTAGGVALASKSLAYDTATNTLKYDAADISWTSATLTAVRNIILYDDTPATDATKPLIAFVTLDQDYACTNGTLSVAWNASGILTVTVA